ncbi:MAG: hypothetical protein LQ344_008010 [Seirophora lacunosa]|nr:MAG: hypothetical protein LQ344_008010 [Seirophora lacunosa]
MAEQERALAIHPIVAESVQHNTQTLSTIRSLTSSLFGISAGILGLESYSGFLFYILGTLFVSLLVHGRVLLAEGARTEGRKGGGGAGRYFQSPARDLWFGEGVVGGLSSFVMTWTLFYGLVRV